MCRGWCSKGVVGFCLISAIPILLSCSGIRELAESVGVKHPTARFAGAKLTGLSFQDADFMFDIQIQNPNPDRPQPEPWMLEPSENKYLDPEQLFRLIDCSAVCVGPIPIQPCPSDIHAGSQDRSPFCRLL